MGSLKDVYENCDYLNYVVKESLRIDGPTMQGIMYYAKQDVTICGVLFKSGTKIYPNLIYSNNNSSEWHEPRKFVPDRFDPDSKYFYKPGSERQPRHSNSFIPFGYGPRSCMGQALGKLETKVVVSRILSSLDIEVDHELLDNECVSFNVFSQFKLRGRVTDRVK